jgi:hypothetical protein
LIGTLRRDSLDHVIVFNERQLLQLLKGVFDDGHYPARCRQSLAGNSPLPRSLQPPALGKVVSVPTVGRLHHVYRRAG